MYLLAGDQQTAKVWRASPTSDMTQALNFIVFRPGVIHLTASPDQCNLGTIVRSDVEATGRFYLLESRLELVENTVEKPASSGSWVRGRVGQFFVGTIKPWSRSKGNPKEVV